MSFLPAYYEHLTQNRGLSEDKALELVVGNAFASHASRKWYFANLAKMSADKATGGGGKGKGGGKGGGGKSLSAEEATQKRNELLNATSQSGIDAAAQKKLSKTPKSAREAAQLAASSTPGIVVQKQKDAIGRDVTGITSVNDRPIPPKAANVFLKALRKGDEVSATTMTPANPKRPEDGSVVVSGKVTAVKVYKEDSEAWKKGDVSEVVLDSGQKIRNFGSYVQISKHEEKK